MRLLAAAGIVALLAAQSTLAQEVKVKEGKKVALLVGVAKYDGTGLTNLKYAEKDMTDLAAALTALGYKVTLVTREEFKKTDKDFHDPTAENIRDQLAAVVRDRKPEDTVLVAFSGHGVHLKETDKLYFCPAKTKLDKPETLVEIDAVMAALGECKADSKVLLMDACRNDPTDGKSGGDAKLKSATLPLIPDPPGGTVALFSCSKGQISHESEKFERGFMMHFVIDGLKGKAANAKTGAIGWDKLVAHVKDEVADAVKEQKGPAVVQSPQSLGKASSIVLGRGMDAELAKEWAEVQKLIRAGRSSSDFVKAAGKDRLAAWRAAAEGGSPEAMFLHAKCWHDGVGVAKDAGEAVKWYRKAADLGNGPAMNGLGVCYKTGQGGLAPDDREAVKWYRKAADLGIGAAMNNLGACNQKGAGTEKDLVEAVKWYRKGSEAGHPEAAYNLGWCLEHAAGVGMDAQEAVKWYAKSADLGNAMAMNNLGSCYERGFGTGSDLGAAVKWYRLAAKEGIEEAKGNLRRLGLSE